MIEVRELTKRYGAATAVDGLSFTVRPGAVTPFAVINDRENAVTMVLDSGVMGGGPKRELVNCHPLVNTMTTALAPDDLVRFLEAERHAPQMLDF